MPFGKWASFEDCVQDMMKTHNYDEETAKKVCGKLQAQLGEESFSWVGNIKPVPGVTNLIRGEALHPLKTVHPEEWPETRVYLEEELRKSAETLKGKPLFLDHFQPLNGKVTNARYEDGAIEYVAQLNDPDVYEDVRQGRIKHCSVEFEWKSLENVDGVAPRGINFTGLSLLKNFLPGDSRSSVEVWEGIIAKLKEAKNVRRDVHKLVKEQAEPQQFIFYVIRDAAEFIPEMFSTTWVDEVNGVQAITGRLREHPDTETFQALLFMKANNWTLEKMQDWLQSHSQYLRGPAPAQPGIQPAGGVTGAVMKMSKNPIWERIWTRRYISELPNSAFAIVYKEDDRVIRKFPHHRADGTIDLPHLRNANARVPQSDLTAEQKAEAQRHLDRHKKAAGIGEVAEESKRLKEQNEEAPEKAPPEEVPEVEFEIAPEPTMDELIESVEEALEEINVAIDQINENFAALDERLKRLEGGGTATEQQGNEEPPKAGQPKTGRERLIAHFGEDVALKLLDLIGEEAYKLLPERGTKIQGESRKKGLGEAIIEPRAPSEPSDLISRKEVLALIPERRIWRSWSYGPQRLIMDLKRKLEREN